MAAWFKIPNVTRDWDEVSLGGLDNVAQLKRAVQAVVKPRLDDYLVADIIIKARRRGNRSERDDDDAVEFNARTTLSLVLWRPPNRSRAYSRASLLREC